MPLHAGISANCPLILQGQCNGHPVVILIDSGATHDFVAQKFVSRQVPSEAKSCIRHTVQWADGRACVSDQRLCNVGMVWLGPGQEVQGPRQPRAGPQPPDWVSSTPATAGARRTKPRHDAWTPKLL